MDCDNSQAATAGTRSRKLPIWKKLLFATSVCTFFFALCELSLWAGGVATLIGREDPFRGFSGLVTIFEQEGGVYRTKLASRGGTFNDQSFRSVKPVSCRRIFCLGGSSSYGFPWDAEVAFTAFVDDALAASHPELQIEVVNASGISYAMHRLNIIADELLAYEPDVFIIYSGHNEFIEPAFFEALKRRSTVRTHLEYMLAHSRVHSAVRSVVNILKNEKPDDRQQFGADVRRDHSRIFSSKEKEAIVAEFRWRLERLVRRAQQAGAKVVLSTVPCNLRGWSPAKSTMGRTMTANEQRKWTDAVAVGKRQLVLGNLQSAFESLHQAASSTPKHAEVQFLLGQTLDKLGRWDEARQAYQQACDMDASPTRRVSGINEAIREVAHQNNVLLVDVDQIFEQQSEHGLVGYNLIEDYVHPSRAGHQLIAWHIWNAIEREGWFGEKSGADRALFERLADQRRSRPVTENAKWLYNQGVVLTNQGQHEAAIKKYRQALARDPMFAGALLNLGELLSKTGQFAEAVEVCRRLVAMEPNMAQAHYLLGSALRRLGRSDAAAAHYRRAVQIKPDHIGARNDLAVSLVNQGNLKEAGAQFQDIIRIAPDYAGAYLGWGNLLAREGRNDDAANQYKKALRLDPGMTHAHYHLGRLLSSQDRVEQAISSYRDALRFNPDFAEAHVQLGNAQQQLGRFAEAIGHFQHAVRIKPNLSEAYNGWGVVLAKQGRLQEAATQFQHAVRCNPDSAEARTNLGRAQTLLEQKPDR